MFGIRQRPGLRFEDRSSLRISLALLVVAPGLILVGLGGYAANALLRQGMELRADAQLIRSVGVPAQQTLANLQQERRLTAVWHAEPSSSAADALRGRRQQTDTAVQEYRRRADAAMDGTGGKVASQARTLRNALDGLAQRRSAVDNRAESREAAVGYYTETIAHGIRLLHALSRTTDGDLAHGVDAVAALAQQREMLSREDTLLSAALASGRMGRPARTEFAEHVAAQRNLGAMRIAGQLPGGDAQAYARITGSPQWAEMVSIENSVVGGSALPAADEWRSAVDRPSSELRELSTTSLDAALDDSTDRAEGLLLRTSVGVAAGLLALALLGVLSARFSRSLVRRLSRLRDATQQAGALLPEVAVRREQEEHAENADVAEAARRPKCGADEVGRLADDVAALGQTAEDTVVRQAEGREGTTKILVNLARRTQILVHREISMLDAMERTYEDAELLEKLFAVDHTATRVRRHAENLLLLGGSLVPRWQEEAMSLVDVLRSAVSETEQYLRVTMETQLPRLSLVGPAGKDVIHLVAELIENGTSFSPPHTKVEVRAEEVPNGLVIEVEDRGLGMKFEDYEHHNERLADPPTPEMVLRGEDTRLGLFVVARLAQRHAIEVSLRRSRYGGTCAIVLLPKDLLEKPRAETAVSGLLPAGARVVTSKEDAGAAHQDSAEHPGHEGVTAAPSAAPSAAPDPQLLTAPPASGTGPAVASEPEAPPTGSGDGPAAGSGDGRATPAEEDMTGNSSPQQSVTDRGLPKRAKGTNLAWQLHESANSPQSDNEADDSSPEQIGTVLAAIQRGAMQAQATAPAGHQEAPAGTSSGPDLPDVSPQIEDDRDADADPGR